MTNVECQCSTIMKQNIISKFLNLETNLMEPENIKIIQNTNSHITLQMTYKKGSCNTKKTSSKLREFLCNWCCSKTRSSIENDSKTTHSLSFEKMEIDEVKNKTTAEKVINSKEKCIVMEENRCSKHESSPSSSESPVVKHQYFAICIPKNVLQNPEYDVIKKIRFCDPDVEDFYAPERDEVVAVPIRFVEQEIGTKLDQNWTMKYFQEEFNLDIDDIRKILQIICNQNLILNK